MSESKNKVVPMRKIWKKYPLNESLITKEIILKHLSYDRKNGVLYWENPPKNCKHLIGKKIQSKNNKGYISFSFKGMSVKAHRLIWFLEKGSWPKKQIDHINGASDDNRIENLRDVSNRENCSNKKIHRKSKKLIGAFLVKSTGKWRSVIRVNNKNVHLGTFLTEKEARNRYLKELEVLNG